ncbi:MAG: hypothetical protein H0V49_02465 [Nocardioidaceae bacterium]|nr:hypothetical protein [Nocardioidaceae bacterium]
MSPTTPPQKVGLVLAGLLSAANIPSVFFPTPEGENGPPLAILVVGSILGAIGLVAVIIAWRSGNLAAIRVVAGALIINLLTSLPAFFVDVPAGIKLLVGVGVLLTVLAITLMFSPSRQPAPVLD